MKRSFKIIIRISSFFVLLIIIFIGSVIDKFTFKKDKNKQEEKNGIYGFNPHLAYADYAGSGGTQGEGGGCQGETQGANDC